MHPIETSLEFIVDKPRYKAERPYAVHIGEGQSDKFTPDDPALNSIDLKQEPVTVYDLRALNDVTLDKYGFQTGDCIFTPFPDLDKVTEDQVESYQIETEDFLKKSLGAEKVICYDYRLRRNGPAYRDGLRVNMNDPLLLDRPPKGAHNDITYDSGPLLIKKVLGETGNLHLLNKKNRIRIVNTWRPLVGKLEDCPLAVCDYRTIKLDDLLSSDRVYVSLRTQLYYLKHNPDQRWYWFSHQTPNEVMMMLMYDTKPGIGHANCCPHVSFHNPFASGDCPLRESVETRNLVISLASETD